MFKSVIEPSLDDGTGFIIGQRVFIDDIYSQFYGVYLGLTPNGLAKVRDDETGDMFIGCVDFLCDSDC